MDCFELFVRQVQQVTDQEQIWSQNFVWDGHIIGVGFAFPPSKDLNDIRTHFERQGVLLRSEAQRTDFQSVSRVILRCSCAFRKRSRSSTKKNTFSHRSQTPELSCAFRISLKHVAQWTVISLVTEHTFHFRYASENLITRKSQLPMLTINLCLSLFEAHTATTTIRQLLQNQGYSVTKKFLQNLRRDEFRPFESVHFIPKGLALDPHKKSQTLSMMALLQHQKTPFVICFEVVFFLNIFLFSNFCV